MSKQDRQGVRTATGLEQKYNFGQSFAEINGIATDARDLVENLEEKFEKNMTAEQIFNVLTNNGANQGLYRDGDGEIYINAKFIKSVDAIFTKDINLSGTFTYKTTTFLEPEKEEINTLKKHILQISTIPSNKISLYDIDGSGDIDIGDVARFKKAALGMESLADWSGAVKTEVTMTINLKDPNKLIRIQGKNMWGRTIDRYVGVGFTNIRQIDVQDYIIDQDLSYVCNDGSVWAYEKWSSGKVVMWATMDVRYANPNVCHNSFALPFAFTEAPHVTATIANCGGNAQSTLGNNVKTENNTSYISVGVHNTSAVFAEGDAVPVSLYVVGTWI